MITSRGTFARRVLPSVLVWANAACTPDESTTGLAEAEMAPADLRRSDVEEGKKIFRFDTFGNEVFWTDAVGLHNVVNELSPLTALTWAFWSVRVAQPCRPSRNSRAPRCCARPGCVKVGSSSTWPSTA